MRILIVGAVKGGSVSIGHAIHHAFKEIGQEVKLLDFADFAREMDEIVRTGNNDLGNRFLLKCFNRLMRAVLDFKPDAILGIAQSPMVNSDLLIRLRKAGIILCFWFVEDYRFFTYWQSYAPLFNHYFTIQKDPFWKELRQMGCNNHHYLPAAFDERFLRSDPVQEPDINLSFVGAPYPNRVYFFSQLRRDDFVIFGDDWEYHGNNSVVIGNRWINSNEARNIYERSFININLHSALNPHSFGEGDFVNPRTFELAGMGAFQLTDMRSLLPLHFDLKDEIVFLKSWEEMKTAMDYFLEHNSERIAIAKKAQKRVLRDHTYRHRAEEIVDILS